MKVLVVDDEEPVRDLVTMALTRDGLEVEQAKNADDARVKLEQSPPSILIVDWMMPGESGISFCKDLRQSAAYKDIPIIMLTAKVQEDDLLKGFESGVDDYLTKPFSVHELRARVRALLKRTYGLDDEALYRYGPFSINMEQQSISVNDEPLKLSPIEYRVMNEMLHRPGRIYSRALLLDRVWGIASDVEERTVDGTMRRIRKVLKEHNVEDWLETVWGSGYRIKVQER